MTSGATPMPQPSVGVARRVLGMLAIVAVFVLIGPPVGAFTLLFAVAAVNMANPDLAGLSWVAIFALLYGIPMSYLFGVFPAAIAGLMIGGWQVFVGRATWMIALGVGVIVGLGFLFAVGRQPTEEGAKAFEFWEYPPIFLLTCLVPAMLCWAIVRNWFQARSIAVTGAVHHVE